MAHDNPTTELDAPYSGPDAEPTPWATARETLDQAEVYWLSTVRADGRPHVTPVVAVWLDGALYFSTGPEEQKSKNLEGNAQVAITTGRNSFNGGLDVIVEGDAVRTTDDATLQRLADLFAPKYDDVFGFRVKEGSFVHDEGGVAHVYQVAPAKVFSYSRDDPGAATRYRF